MHLRPFSLALLTALTVSLTSCFQVDNDNALNADGSGKFSLKASMNPGGALGGLGAMLGKGGDASEAKDPTADKEKDEDMLADFMAKTKGVDVWKEATLTKKPNGKMTISVSGYFKDITKFSPANPLESLGLGDLAGAVNPGADKNGGNPLEKSNIGALKSSKDAAGNWIVELSTNDMAPATAKAPAADAKPKAKLSAAERKASIEGIRSQFEATKPIMQGMMGGIKFTQVVKVGGTITDYGMLTKVDEHTAKLEISFSKLFDGIEKVLANDALAAQLVDATGGQLEPMSLLSMIQGDELDAALKDKISTAILGGAGDAKLVIKPGSAAFDYATESAAAAAAQSPELKRLLKK